MIFAGSVAEVTTSPVLDRAVERPPAATNPRGDPVTALALTALLASLALTVTAGTIALVALRPYAWAFAAGLGAVVVASLIGLIGYLLVVPTG